MAIFGAIGLKNCDANRVMQPGVACSCPNGHNLRSLGWEMHFFFGGLFVFIPISYESPTGAAPLSLSGLWVADVKPLSPCPLSQLLRVTLLRIKYLLT